jgi:hypothetical protein
MAQDHSGPTAKAPWTKIFTAFKVALDVKKMALAAAGIFLVFAGWWAISATFFYFRTFPVYVYKTDKDKTEDKDKKEDDKEKQDAIKAEWNRFKARRLSWNLLYKLAGYRSEQWEMVDAGDIATSHEEYIVLDPWVKGYRDKTLTLGKIADDAKEKGTLGQQALVKFDAHIKNPEVKPYGSLRISPWDEYRGENQYLIVAGTIKDADTVRTGRSMLNWVFSERVLVLLEPLVKFLLPVVYTFDERAGVWDRLYLILILLWTLAVWGFFGGAISRIAAVQIARNERISLGEAISFTRERALSFMGAPVFPLALLAIFVFGLMIFGWIEWIPWLGDLWAGLLWPIVLVIGFIMAIVLVGLVGWPLMIATISTEGTDAFDALSRSYSYIYQAPWQYLWYNFLAVLYGAVLVFFIGFMASLMVFAGKWGVSSAPGLAKSDPKTDREPSYLFYYAPTSYGWRDLLISSNTEHVEKVDEIAPDGHETKRYEFKKNYELSNMNHVGAFLVACWIYPLFLLVLGFGYSYFWSSSTIIYFLMRHHVDDTEMDEVHQEDDDLEDPFTKATTPPPPPAPAAPASKPSTLSLNVVEAPLPPAPSTNITPAPNEPPAPPPEAPPATPPSDGHS